MLLCEELFVSVCKEKKVLVCEELLMSEERVDVRKVMYSAGLFVFGWRLPLLVLSYEKYI